MTPPAAAVVPAVTRRSPALRRVRVALPSSAEEEPLVRSQRSESAGGSCVVGLGAAKVLEKGAKYTLPL